MEGKNYTVTGELEYSVQNQVKNTKSKELDKKKIEMFEDFIGNL
jgi:hypothetical protein